MITEKILIGSRALMWLFPKKKWRSTIPDEDYLIPTKDINDFRSGVNQYRDMGWDATPVSEEIFRTLYSRATEIGENTRVISPIDLLTLKLSHLGWDLDWFKHHKDVLNLISELRELAIIKGELSDIIDRDLFKSLYSWWDSINSGKRALSLNMSKEEFFDDAVEKVYDHDYLHELVAYPDPPLYSLCQREGAEVSIDVKKFSKFSHDKKVRMFREEATVISIERWLVNPNMKIVPTWEWSYGQALKKLCTTLTKGWATRFCILNIEELSRLDESLLIHAKKVIHLNYPVPQEALLSWKHLLESSDSLSGLSSSKMWAKEERRVIKFEEKFIRFFTLEKFGEIVHIFEMKEVIPKTVAITKYV
jgi:hypothetical protein